MRVGNTSKGFTLLELLVVIGIMGLLGTAAVGGYHQMQRGLEDRRVVDNVSKFVTLAAERCQIDRQPVAIYYWNEMVHKAVDEDENDIIVGKAVAVRAKGYVTRVYQGYLIDEFGDFEVYDASGNYQQPSAGGGVGDVQKIRFYNMNASERQYSLVSRREKVEQTLEAYMSSQATMESGGLSSDDGANGVLMQFGYRVEDINGVSWKVGSRYGLEFQQLELPHGYFFDGPKPSTETARTAAKVVYFQPQAAGTLPSGSLDVYSLRQQGGVGTVDAKIGTANVN